jgi:hypothetical protein
MLTLYANAQRREGLGAIAASGSKRNSAHRRSSPHALDPNTRRGEARTPNHPPPPSSSSCLRRCSSSAGCGESSPRSSASRQLAFRPGSTGAKSCYGAVPESVRRRLGAYPKTFSAVKPNNPFDLAFNRGQRPETPFSFLGSWAKRRGAPGGRAARTPPSYAAPPPPTSPSRAARRTYAPRATGRCCPLSPTPPRTACAHPAPVRSTPPARVE